MPANVSAADTPSRPQPTGPVASRTATEATAGADTAEASADVKAARFATWYALTAAAVATRT